MLRCAHVAGRLPRRDLGLPPCRPLRPVLLLELTFPSVRSSFTTGALPCCCTPPVLPARPRPPRWRWPTSTALTRRIAAEVHAGRHPVHIDPLRRWYQLLRADDFVDVWLISWATEQTAELHDHAGSLGALTVVSGELLEQRWVRRRAALAAAAGRPQRGLPARARARRRQPRARARGQRARLLAPADRHVLLRGPAPTAGRPGARLRRTRSVLVESGSSEGVG